MIEDLDFWREEAKYVPTAEECVKVGEAEVIEAFERAKRATRLFVDCETNKLNFATGHAIGLSMSDGELGDNGHVWSVYVPWGHRGYPGEVQEQASFELVKELMRQLVTELDPKAWAFFHGRFDRIMLGNTLKVEIPFHPQAYDVMHMLQVLNPASSHGLKEAGATYLGIDLSKWEGPLEKYRWDQDNTGDEKVPPYIEGPYAATDAKMTAGVEVAAMERIRKAGLEKILKFETAILPTIINISKRQVVVEQSGLREYARPLQDEIKRMKKQFAKLTGFNGDTDNPEALRHWLYTVKGYPVLDTTGKGEPSVAGWTVEKIAKVMSQDREALELLATLREKESVFRRRLAGLLMEGAEQALVGLDVAQMGKSGEWSMWNPDLSDWDSSTSLAIRKALRVPKGKVWVRVVAPDLGVTLMANQSIDEHFKQVCAKSFNITQNLAKEVGIDARLCELVILGKRRGMGYGTMSRVWGIDEKEAHQAWDKLVEKFSGLTDFYFLAKGKVENGQPLTTTWGRRVFVEHNKAYQSSGRWLAAKEADIWKWLGVKLDRKLRDIGQGELLMPLENGILFEVDKGYLPQFIIDLHKSNVSLVEKGNLPIPWQVSIARQTLEKMKKVTMPIPEVIVTDPEHSKIVRAMGRSGRGQSLETA